MDSNLSLHYIELSKNPIRFDAASQLTNVFFDDSNKQIFTVRSGGVAGVVVKTESSTISFRMNDRGPICSIKFSPDNKILALQRKENAIEFLYFVDEQPLEQDIIVHQIKSNINGFVWVHNRECAVISNVGIEIFSVLPEKKQVKSVKAITKAVKWFAWCAETNIALLCAKEDSSLIPVILKQKTITKLPKLDVGNREIPESKITLGQIYGTMAVLIVQDSAGIMEVEVYLLNGPGLAARKCHVLRLGYVGRFAINTLDNLIVVHHQASASSLLFDIALNGEVVGDVTYHSPITPARSIRPFGLKIPSLSGQIQQCELYSSHWILFQPNIVIDAKLGCMWYLNLCIEPFSTLLSDRIKLTEFLLQRTMGKQILLKVLRQLAGEEYSGTYLPIVETIFNKVNKVYATWIQIEIDTQTAQPLNVKNSPNKSYSLPKVVINQLDMYSQVFEGIAQSPQIETILMLYMQSLSKHNIAAQEDISKMIINVLIQSRNFDTLQRLTSYSLLQESKAIACFLLSHSDVDETITQIALNMLGNIKAHEIIVEVLLGEGRVIEALKHAKSAGMADNISARKFLEAAKSINDDCTYHSIYKFFQMRNMKLRNSVDFLRTEQCTEFDQHYISLYANK